MPVTKFPFLTIFYFAKGAPFRSYISLEDFSKKLITTIRNFALRKKGREKTQMVKVENFFHQVTWTQINMTKRRARVNF